MNIEPIMILLAKSYIVIAVLLFVGFHCKNLRKSKRSYIAQQIKRGNTKAVNQVLARPSTFYVAYTFFALTVSMIWLFRANLVNQLLKF